MSNNPSILTNQRITNLETTVFGGIKDSLANACQTSNIVLTSLGNGSYTINETSLGGVNIALNGKSFLLAGQTNTAENGIYAITALSPSTLIRATNFVKYDEINNARIQIREGTNAGNFYLCTTTKPFTINATAIIVADTDPALENLEAQIVTKQNLVSSPTADNILLTDANGQSMDSGKKFSTDGTLAENSDNLVSTQKSVKTYIDGVVVGALSDRGSWDASGGLFPATGGSGASGSIKKGDLWFVSVAGTLGGSDVTIGDSFRALIDAPGQAASNWNVIQVNITYVPENVTNKSTDGTLGGVTPSDTLYPSQKAAKDYADTKTSSTLPDSQIYVGNAAGVATAVSISGEVTLTNTGSITINDDAITTDKILDNNVTNAKLDQASANTYKGNATGSTANVSDISTNTAFNQNFETIASVLTKPSRTSSVGTSNNIIRADAVFPIDSKKQNRIITVADRSELLALAEDENSDILLDVDNTIVKVENEKCEYTLIGTPATDIANWRQNSIVTIWVDDRLYNANSFVTQDDNLYRSVQEVPINESPVDDTSETYWELISDATVDYVRTIAERVSAGISGVQAFPLVGTDTFYSKAGAFYARNGRSEVVTATYTAQSPLSFTFYTRNGAAIAPLPTGLQTAFNSTYYDNNGVITDLAANGNFSWGALYANPANANDFAFLIGQKLFTGGSAQVNAQNDIAFGGSLVLPTVLTGWKEVGKLVYKRDLVSGSNFDDNARFTWIASIASSNAGPVTLVNTVSTIYTSQTAGPLTAPTGVWTQVPLDYVAGSGLPLVNNRISLSAGKNYEFANNARINSIGGTPGYLLLRLFNVTNNVRIGEAWTVGRTDAGATGTGGTVQPIIPNSNIIVELQAQSFTANMNLNDALLSIKQVSSPTTTLTKTFPTKIANYVSAVPGTGINHIPYTTTFITTQSLSVVEITGFIMFASTTAGADAVVQVLINGVVSASNTISSFTGPASTNVRETVNIIFTDLPAGTHTLAFRFTQSTTSVTAAARANLVMTEYTL